MLVSASLFALLDKASRKVKALPRATTFLRFSAAFSTVRIFEPHLPEGAPSNNENYKCEDRNRGVSHNAYLQSGVEYHTEESVPKERDPICRASLKLRSPGDL